jgi:hypothetical protein
MASWKDQDSSMMVLAKVIPSAFEIGLSWPIRSQEGKSCSLVMALASSRNVEAGRLRNHRPALRRASASASAMTSNARLN